MIAFVLRRLLQGVIVMLVVGAVRFPNFLSAQVFLNLLIDHSFLVVVAVGMTFVILSGGIDLSVGAVVALSITPQDE